MDQESRSPTPLRPSLVKAETTHCDQEYQTHTLTQPRAQCQREWVEMFLTRGVEPRSQRCKFGALPLYYLLNKLMMLITVMIPVP